MPSTGYCAKHQHMFSPSRNIHAAKELTEFIISERTVVFKGNFPDLSCLKGWWIVHGANGTAAIQSELQPCGNRTMKPHELTILGHTHTQKLAHSIMTFSRIHMQDLHTLLRNKTALKNPYRPYPARVLVGLRGFEPLTSTMRMLRATICAIAPYIFLGTFGLEVSCHGKR